MSKYKVLVIDYEPRGIQQLTVPLEEAGYEVYVEKNGVSGMRTFSELKPDLAVIEAMLPKKNGFELCQELKKTPQGSRTPIVLVSSVYKGRKYRTQALHHYGCNEYLEKPVAPEKLLETVRRLLKCDPETAHAGSRSREDPMEAEILSRIDEVLPGDKVPRK
jgi:DNA-binding response OmpR family regulator